MTEDIALRENITPAKNRDSSIPASDSNPIYNLVTHNPFADDQGTMSYFFEGSDRASQLEEAKHLSQFGNNITLITGDTGAGKTFFLEQACFELAESASCCFIAGSETLTSEAIAKEVSTELSMPFATRQTIEELIDMLEDADALEDVARFVLIIDDIHLLSEDIILSLLQLSQLSGNVFHLLASGLPSTFEFLGSLSFQDGLIKKIHLYPFGPEETEEYLNFKMQSAGFKGSHYFDAESVAIIYKQSAGYPQKINQIAETLLLSQDHEMEQTEEDESINTAGFPLWHMVGAIFLLFVLILAFFYRGGSSTESVEQTLANPTQQNPNVLINPPTESITPVTTPDTIENELPEVTEPMVAVDAEQLTAIENSVEPTSEPVTDSLPVINDPVAETTETISAAIDDVAITEPATPAVETAPTATIQNTTSAINDTPPEQTVAVPNQAEPTFSQDEQTVLNWPDEHRTIQIIGALDKASLEQYVTSQANRESLHLVTILRNEQPWHIVLAGHFAGNNEARQAIQRLPQNQVNAGPWIRSVSDLKQGIRDFRR